MTLAGILGAPEGTWKKIQARAASDWDEFIVDVLAVARSLLLDKV